MTEEVRWTPWGRAELDEVSGAMYRDTDDAELRAKVLATAKQLAPMWKKGAEHAKDDEGEAAVAFASATLGKGKLPKRPSVDDAARLLSLVGADESDQVAPFGELLLREQGLPFAMAVLARMWSLGSMSKGQRKPAIWIYAVADDDDHVHDASGSYPKAAFAHYLARRGRIGTAADRAAMKKGATAIWNETTPHARPALAYASNDPDRAKQSAEELIHAGESPYPYFAWDQLPYVLTDAELALRLLRDRQLTVRLIENLGEAVWPVYEERIGSPIDARYRARLLRELANFYGPRTAILIAEYEDSKECRPVVVDYFGLYPELLDRVIDEPALTYHREDLEKLRATAGTPDRARRRS